MQEGNYCSIVIKPILNIYWQEPGVVPRTHQGCQIGHFCGQIKLINRSFAAIECHSLLWSKATTFFKSQRGYPRPSAATVHYNQRPQLRMEDGDNK